MTGFGDADGTWEGIAFHIELRCVNQKGFKLVSRLPDTLHALEADLEPLLRSKLERGSCLCVLTMQKVDTHSAYAVNQASLDNYLSILAPLAEKQPGAQTNLSQLLTLPGVLEPLGADEGFIEKSKPWILDLVIQASDNLLEMREREGNALSIDLHQHLDVIASTRETIASHVSSVLADYQQRLKSRVDELLANSSLTLDEGTLLREVAVFADRSDISEEISRLQAHVEAFIEELNNANGKQVGRRLDFLSQELLREANTIASKAASAEIARCVVELKTRIDRIKEQVQNVV